MLQYRDYLTNTLNRNVFHEFVFLFFYMYIQQKSVTTKTINSGWIFNFVFSCLFLLFMAGCKNDLSMVNDVDGNSYHTIKIGTQTWMVENLKTTKFNDGAPITLIRDSASWKAALSPGYCFYRNDSAKNKLTYGALYNWYAVNTGKLAPKGWHIPTDAEWSVLIKYVSSKYNTSCSAAKALALNSIWRQDSTGCSVGNDQTKNNGSGFSAVPGGIRNVSSGSYASLDSNGNWWSSTQVVPGWAGRISLYNNFGDVGRGNEFTQAGLSVRCIKD